MGAVGRGRRQPGGKRARFVDALFENLAILGLLDRRQSRRSPPAHRAGRPRVDAELAEQAFHAEGSRLVRDDGDDPRANLPCRAAACQAAAQSPSSWSCCAPRSLELLLESFELRDLQGFGRDHPLRDRSAERLPLLRRYTISGESSAGSVVGNVFELFIAERHIEAIAEVFELFES